MTSSPDILAAFAARLAERGFTADPAQQAAMQRLHALNLDLQHYTPPELASEQKGWRKLLSRKTKSEAPQSVYFWGGVGRGKSFLMDCFFDTAAFNPKRRVHFHAFMQRVQNDLKDHNQQEDPLQIVADNIAREARLLCFDEFHVSDIADAMILGRLLEALFARGVVFVMTSNYPPVGLYPNGLMRINFLPTIRLIEARFDVLEIDHGTDYRLRTLEDMTLYLTPADAAAETRLGQDFQRLCGCAAAAGEIEILGRTLATRGRANGVIWFDFDTLCATARSQNDYLEIVREHHTVLLSGVPHMDSSQAAAARRFTWLVDVLYDHRTKLIICADVAAEALYTDGPNAHEFVRTVSRLVEMRSREYLAQPKRELEDSNKP